MQLVILTIISYIVLGGIGMYFGNRKVTTDVARQRWLKYVSYIIITSIVALSIWFHFFFVVAISIVLFGYYELMRTDSKFEKPIALLVYTIVAAGFMVYAFKFIKEAQFFIYFQILSFDAFSQVTGQLIGKTAIAPRISPSKTMEGFAGGLLFCILASILTSHWFDIPVPAAILSGLFTAITGFTGDMLASWYKRVAGIKDYSRLLPGQGGFLDRFDGFMMTAFCYSIIYAFAIRITGIL